MAVSVRNQSLLLIVTVGGRSAMLTDRIFVLFLSCRFHPENAQEFISIKKTKSESWKCDVRTFNSW